MKIIILMCIAILSINLQASTTFNVVSCDNLSEDFFEDVLIIDFYQNIAIYSPNDQDKVLPCSSLDNGVTTCSDGFYTIVIPHDGKKTKVYEGVENPNVIDFDCEY